MRLELFRLLMSAFNRLTTAVTMPFRRMLYGVKRMFNVNIITSKIIQPITKQIKIISTLKPTNSADYISVGWVWIYRKVFYLVVLILCAGVFLYFAMFASPVDTAPVSLVEITTGTTYAYDDMEIQSFSGIANITDYSGAVVYTGEIAGGVCRGQGRLYSKEGALVYEGEFQNNKYNGAGIKYFAGGAVQYDGEFVDNLYGGAGRLYSAGGALLYDGQFDGGAYNGSGKLYGEDGLLRYDGSFSDGLAHGTGTEYFENGNVRYEGEFFGGKAQGRGILYSTAGKKLYSGSMHQGDINYTTLLGASLQEIEAAFFETPRIYYMENGNGCFYFEEAGVIVSTDCRVMIYEWEREKDNISEGFYYMPDDLPGGNAAQYTEEGGFSFPAADPGAEDPPGAAEVPEPYQPESSTPSAPGDTGQGTTAQPSGNWSVVKAAPSQSSFRAPLVQGQSVPSIRPVAWATIDDPYTQPSESSSESSSQSTSSGSYSSEAQEAEIVESSEPERGIERDSGANQVESVSPWPEFVERNKQLYFEIDTDVWQSEAELDRSKVSVSRVTVLGACAPDDTLSEIEDQSPAALEDCIAVDAVRMSSPTSFSSIMFEMDKSNRLFVRVWNINYANRMERRTFLDDSILYRYVYDESGEGGVAAYFSLER